MSNPREEKTFVLLKPDGVRRGLIGEVIKRIEQRGLKIAALEMARASREQIDGHYPHDEEWIRRVGRKTYETYQKYGYDAKSELGTEDLLEIGQMVRRWLLDFMTSGPVVKIVVEGVHAVDAVRKLVGNTMPALAEMGTIRGDFSVDSAALANKEKRAVFNLVHASETPKEAEHEIAYWFGKDSIQTYKRTDDSVYTL
ncbi:MAG: nucleoside-diphosphate kinase [Parcubacteria group bacterium]|nr:nucleoside-diphosphate kinase [Parcubacteria group bacterium]